VWSFDYYARPAPLRWLEYFMRRAEVLMNTSPQFKLLLVEAINEETRPTHQNRSLASVGGVPFP
jgi:hypothetical protein